MYNDTNIVSLTGRTTKDMTLSADGKVAFATLAVNRYYKREGTVDFTESTTFVDVTVSPAPESLVAKGTDIEVVDANIDAKANAYYGQEDKLYSSNRVRVHRNGFRQTTSVAGSHRNVVLATGRVVSVDEFGTANGSTGVGAPIAINRSYISNGERQQFTVWVSAVAWNDSVKRRLNAIPVGAKVFFKGYLDKTPSVPPIDSERLARNRVVLTDVTLLALPRSYGQNSNAAALDSRVNGKQPAHAAPTATASPAQQVGLGQEIPSEYDDLNW